ncbi:MAG TPA: hypothetical protein VK606_08615 [Verrucomicrobiae bacterium]|nr:hypothetical protein [Verrucomicrobiae bacterium]
MRSRTSLLTLALLLLSCGGSSPSASHSPRASASPSSTASPSSPTGGPLTGAYGLLLSAGTLQLIKTDGSVAAGVPVAAASTQSCSGQQDRLVAPPPASASNDEVYFRDGDTRIRMVVPPGSAADVTSVPGGPNIISFFSVSPDDQQIAVFTENVSSGTGIDERLYVEDLHGGGHHVDIYTTQVPKDERGTTLWPMGWHGGALVLAVFRACTSEASGLQPREWHVSNAVSGARVATISGTNCVLSTWPSAGGVGCMDPQGVTTLYNWAGKVVSVTGPGIQGAGSTTGLSPAGQSIFFSTGTSLGQSTPTTRIVQLGPGPYTTVQGHAACGWIDEDHLLAGDAVIQFPAETPGNLQVTATATPLEASGQCAGRFPGSL